MYMPTILMVGCWSTATVQSDVFQLDRKNQKSIGK